MAVDIFVSVGRMGTKKQKDFLARVEERLREAEFFPRYAKFSANKPLEKIYEEMAACAGAVIIAHERTLADKLIEFPGGDAEKEKLQNNVKLPTVWNHVEAALAYTFKWPVLVIFDENCKREGLLDNYDWNINPMEIDAGVIDTDRFKGIFADWKKRVDAHAREKAEREAQREAEQSRKRGGFVPFMEFWRGLESTITIGVILFGLGILISTFVLGFGMGEECHRYFPGYCTENASAAAPQVQK